jgi:hypothetical protein
MASTCPVGESLEVVVTSETRDATRPDRATDCRLCAIRNAKLRLDHEVRLMSTTEPLPPKKDVALALLERSSVFVHLDPRPPTVIVPVAYKKQPQLVLRVGLNMPVPIPDLRLDDDGMSCTLSFSRSPFFCVVPWSSVFAMVDDDMRGMVWPEDVPPEVARQQAQNRPSELVPPAARKESAKVGRVREPKQDTGTKAKRPRKRPVLSAVPNGTDAAARPVAAPSVPMVPRREVAPAAAKPMVGGGTARKRRELPPYLRVVK